MRNLLRRIAAWYLDRPKVMQLHLVSADGTQFQVAQKKFGGAASRGAKLDWVSEMMGKAQIPNPRVELVFKGEPKFIPIDNVKGDCDPVFLTGVK